MNKVIKMHETKISRKIELLKEGEQLNERLPFIAANLGYIHKRLKEIQSEVNRLDSL
jgi:hypothetical protein